MYIESFLLTAESYIIIWFVNSQNTLPKFKLKKLMEEKGGV